MPLDYISLRRQIKRQAASAPAEIKRLGQLLEQASQKLAKNANDGSKIREKVAQVTSQEAFLRCALPSDEKLTQSHALPNLPDQASIIAVDGSQIHPNAHEAVHFYLVNLGTIQIDLGSSKAPITGTSSEIHLSDFGAGSSINQDAVSLERDTAERVVLAKMAAETNVQPVITLTDGILELWGGRGRSADENQQYTKMLDKYVAALAELERTGAATAGYVDKPRGTAVVRMLEVFDAAPDDIENIREYHPFRGITDTALFRDLIAPGERSSIFEMQFQIKEHYADGLALHFFYINVGTEANPWLARVEIPLWVVQNTALLDALHAVLIQQSRVLGKISFPYALHRAHEIAVVTAEDREQVLNMLTAELRDQGMDPGQLSFKQSAKNFEGRQRR
jgi:hypothetical protein